MKSFLRADPDIIMVGEMRDKETTGMGIEASLTGHLVFATLHTNSAPESIIRLLDMGLDPFNFADALLGILAQRLAKRLCKCKEAYTPDQNEIKHFLTEYCAELMNTPSSGRTRTPASSACSTASPRTMAWASRSSSCTSRKGAMRAAASATRAAWACTSSWWARIAVKKLIQEHARVAELFAQALTDGMITLKMDGMNKVLQGVTDMAQVRAVCIK
jgi:type II secretory ATPase GspE/PulE/Tfp pilus assembly ATPase PilB-like protein